MRHWGRNDSSKLRHTHPCLYNWEYYSWQIAESMWYSPHPYHSSPRNSCASTTGNVFHLLCAPRGRESGTVLSGKAGCLGHFRHRLLYLCIHLQGQARRNSDPKAVMVQQHKGIWSCWWHSDRTTSFLCWCLWEIALNRFDKSHPKQRVKSSSRGSHYSCRL